MKSAGKSYHMPWAVPVLGFWALLLLAVFALYMGGVAGDAFRMLGLHPMVVPMVLLASVIGAGMSFPFWELAAAGSGGDRRRRAWMIAYRTRETDPGRVVLAVNFGGCLIPAVMAGRLLPLMSSWVALAATTVVVAAASWFLARPVPGVGLAVPMPVPGLLAAGSALLLAPRIEAPAVAMLAGAAGTLLGGCVLRLGSVRGLGGTAVSIGGAGTFEAIFFSGVLAALIG